jgi:hypothetical protein
MARPLRTEYAGAVYHVMTCGNLRPAIGHYTRASQAVSRLQRKPGRKLEGLKRLLLAAEVEND